MDRRTLLAIGLSIAVMIGWQKFYVEPRLPKHPPATSQTESSAPNATASSPATGVPGKPSAKTVPAETKTIPTGTGDATISNGPKILAGWNLKSYRMGLTQETAAVDLTTVTHQPEDIELGFDDPAYAYLTSVSGSFVPSSTANAVEWRYEDENIKLTRVAGSAPDQPWLDLRVSAEFKKTPPKFAYLSISSHAPEKDDESRDRQLIYFTANDIERSHVDDKTKQVGVGTDVKYVGATSRYFLIALLNNGELAPKGLVQPLGNKTARASLVYPVAGNSITMPVKVYFGPKELNLLKSVDPTLDHAIDFGWFTFVAYPLLRLLKWIYGFVGNYGVAIVLLTILLKTVLFPLAYKSTKSMKHMAKVQPQLAKLREKYKDDREALNREMLTLMRTHGYNPMAGCWPVMVQMPVFFALYRVLWGSIELFHQPFFGWIKDLSVHDPYYVTPVLLTLTMWLQQRITPVTATDPAQAKMMQFMPLMFGAMMIWLPSGLTIYMLVNAIMSILQQAVLNKKFDIHPNAPAVPATGAR